MESSEDDRGAARDAVGQPSTRENKEMLSGSNSNLSSLTSTTASSSTMEQGAHSSSAPALDEDGCHNTETILNMIDEFIDEPKSSKSAKYTADSTVSGHTPPRGSSVSSECEYNDRPTGNCVVAERIQEVEECSPDASTVASRGHTKDKKLEEMVNDISSSNQGASGSVSSLNIVDSNTTYDPIESCSKAENLPGQRRKLSRSNLVRENAQPTRENAQPTSVKHHQEEHSTTEELQVKVEVCETTNQLSPKKVKLVRHSNMKVKATSVAVTPMVAQIQVDSSSGASSESRANERLQCSEQSSSSCDVKPLEVHSSRECVLVSDSKNSDGGELITNVKSTETSDVSLTNSVNSINTSQVITNDSAVSDNNKSNDVLDVRKVSPLRLTCTTNVDESLNSNNKNNQMKFNTDTQQVNLQHSIDESNCSKNIPKLTLKIANKHSDESSVKVCNKTVSKLNIKPIKPPPEVADNAYQPTHSKSKHASSDDETTVTNVVKLHIKPLRKPDNIESEMCKDKSSSSSSEVSECESSENEITSECIQSPTVETTESEQAERSVPKLTIKSLSTVPKVDTESSKVGRRSQSPEPPVVPKLHIKPLVPPPIEKMTIKINKTHDSESKCESDNSPVESIPKMTIKIGKNQEATSIVENNCDDDKSEHALKMKIKLGKTIENSVDADTGSASEYCPTTRSSKRLNQKQEHTTEHHVPKLTIKIPPEHESKSSEKSSHSPSIAKLTIKPIVRHEELERSSSPTVPKLTIKPIPKPDHHENRDDDHEHPSISKLNIKPIVKPDELESKLSDTTDSHGIPKLTIKTIKSDDHEARINEKDASPIPKLTIKPIPKPDEVEGETHTITKLTIKPVIRHGEQVSDAEIHPVPKLTIKPVVKPDDSKLEPDVPTVPKLTIKPVIKPGDVETNQVETYTVPKITIKPVIKHDENDTKHYQKASSSIPKLTIKPVVNPDESKAEDSLGGKHTGKKSEEHELRRSERGASPNISKINAKGHHDPCDAPVLQKLTIKPLTKQDEESVLEPSDVLAKVTNKAVINSEDDGTVTKISIKPKSVDKDVPEENIGAKIEEVKEVKVRNKVSLEDTINKLSSKTRNACEKPAEIRNDCEATPKVSKSGEDKKAKESALVNAISTDLTKPLEIATHSVQSSQSQPDSNLDSPRIILKINKSAQGSVSEVLIDDQSKKEETVVAKDIDIKIDEKDEQTIEQSPVETPKEVEAGEVEKVEKKEVIVNDVGEKVNEVSDISKENDEQFSNIGGKRLRNKANVVNKHPGFASTQAKRRKLDNAISNLHNKNRKNATLVDPLSSTESILPKDVPDTTLLNNTSEFTLTNNGESSNLSEIFTNVNSNDHDDIKMKVDFEKINENSSLMEGDSNTTSTKSSEDMMCDTTRNSSDSPLLNKITQNMLVINEETNSQECIMMDELSQDPLDIESAAKSHFPSVSVSITPVMSINKTIKLVEEPSSKNIAVSLGLIVPSIKKRGRPRKQPAPEMPVSPPPKVKEPKQSPKLPTPALEERPVRVLRTPRDKPAILRTPRTRGGRGRGGNRRGLGNSSTRDMGTSPPNSPDEKAVKYFDWNEKNAYAVDQTTPCKVAISRLEESGDEEELLVRSIGVRGGRGRRMMRRGGGGRGSRGGRGKGSRGGLLRGGQRGEEIQLQDALPLTSPVGRRDGRKSKLEPTLTPALQVFEEETCMIGDNVTPKRNIGLVDEESQSSVLSSQTASESGTRPKRPKLMDMLDEGHKEWAPSDIAEYDWPPEGSGSAETPQTVMIQEQVALYLGVKSFKRRYPDLKRRALSAEEKNYLRDRGLISEALCDLGVTAVDAGEVLDIMYTDYPNKYEEYRKHLRERRETKPTATPANKLTSFSLPAAKQSISSKQEILEKACESAASWNAQLNKQRKAQRMSSMDLQTLTMHRPIKRPVVQEPNPSKISYYPVALLPGQFTDHYRDYTPEELRYFPLNTVMDLLPSPKPAPDSSSEESDSNSDSEHNSSGEESDSENSVVETNNRRKVALSKAKSRQSVASSSRPVSPSVEGTPIKSESGAIKTEPSSSAIVEIPNKCKLCDGSEYANKRNPNEAFITCATCRKKIHPTCLELSPMVIKCVRGYAWQCADCKCCGQCGDLADDDKMLFCDLCDRGYHIYCVGLKKVPTGRWHCMHCAACRSCDSRSPSGPQGVESLGTEAAPDQWHHHFKRTNSGQRIYSHTLCAPCAKAWRSGLFCPSCEKCFVGRKGAMGLVICVRCDMRYHQDCIRQVRKQLDVLNFLCTNCRRGTNPKHKLRRAERTPRKAIHFSADSSMHSIVSDSNSSMQNTLLLMDQGGDSSSAIDSMQPSPLQDRNNDSNSVSDLPLGSLKMRHENCDEDKESHSNAEIDFKTASRRLFSVSEACNGSNMPSKTSDAGEKKDVDDASRDDTTNSSLPQDPLDMQDDVEGGA